MRTLCEAKELTMRVSFICEHNANVVAQFLAPKPTSRTDWLLFPAMILSISTFEVTLNLRTNLRLPRGWSCMKFHHECKDTVLRAIKSGTWAGHVEYISWLVRQRKGS